MPRDSGDVPRNAPTSRPGQDGGQKRSERLRARRDEAGLAQVSGWVPKERRAYAREVIAALARGANSLPPDPEQAAALQAAQVEAKAARAELALAEQHGEALTAELDATRASAEAAQQASCQVEAAALARADTAEQALEDALNQMRAAEAAAAQARAEAGQFRQAPGWRGWIMRQLTR